MAPIRLLLLASILTFTTTTTAIPLPNPQHFSAPIEIHRTFPNPPASLSEGGFSEGGFSDTHPAISPVRRQSFASSLSQGAASGIADAGSNFINDALSEEVEKQLDRIHD
ncbi:hypothetical protein MMC07_009107 [Pseudocyphellaria aurata]|nr:hypothetical protein [Pseudocyphellaria aurata]